MQGKTVLISGATNGIGKQAAVDLAQMGAQVVIIGRSKARTDEALREIQTASGNNDVHALLADLSSMAEVRRVADDFRKQFSRLDVLLNNAGGVFNSRQETVDGYEMTFALNHLSYFLLTNLLLDMLKASAPSRIVNVSSEAQSGGALDFDDLQFKNTAYGMGGFKAYAQSKLMNVMFTYELARRLAGTGVTANVLHPGFVNTGFGKNNKGLMQFVMGIITVFAIKVEDGAKTSVYLASSPEVEGVTGKYFDKSKPKRSSPASYDEAAQKRLWEISEQLTGIASAAAV
ncbi:MAG: SDR family NAD(P)-dependent oxidoreductase [Anaerolineaceae bacterium]|nr:SDR family NAD(P)-dependent oxidoreductase [Anaerolineaceae bacterium]